MRRLLRLAPPSLALLCGALLRSEAAAQIPYYVFDAGTQVASIDFHFPNGRTFSDDELLEHMVLEAPGFLGKLRRRLAFLPLVSAPEGYPFSPLDLQRDVARLRRFYAESGFLDTDVRYEVDFDSEANRVDVDMILSEGRPITLRSVRTVTSEGGDPVEAVPEELVEEWRRVEGRRRDAVGRRYTQAARSLLVGNAMEWWMNRGWAFVWANAVAEVDSAAAAADLTIRLDPGPRARVDSIDIEGNESVSDELVLRSLPFREGDWFSSEQLSEGQSRLFGLELFRLALVGTPPDQPRDSSVLVRVRLEESPPRLFTGEFGYVSAGGGLTGRAEIAHRNFMGGARTLRVNGTAQTGLLSMAEQLEREYRLSVSFHRPFTFHPRMSMNLAPYGSYRDDIVDRSWEIGMESSLIYQLGARRFVTLQHRYSSKRVLDYRLGASNALDLETLFLLLAEGALDSLENRIDRSTLALTGTIGRFDPTSPNDALQGTPSVEVTVPGALNTIEYTRVEVPVLGFLEFGSGFALAGQLRWGRVYPFGKTLEGDTVATLLQAAQLRQVFLTAGGTSSVRGWGTGMMGPKFPNLVFSGLDTDSATAVTDGYLPSGGLARATASVELRMPFPGLASRWGTHLFLDAGRVWNPDERFQTDDPLDQHRWFYGTGAGIDLDTAIGPIRLSVGYKLNPSPLDLRDARDVFAAALNDRPLSSVPTSSWRRWHLHIGLGQTF